MHHELRWCSNVKIAIQARWARILLLLVGDLVVMVVTVGRVALETSLMTVSCGGGVCREATEVEIEEKDAKRTEVCRGELERRKCLPHR